MTRIREQTEAAVVSAVGGCEASTGSNELGPSDLPALKAELARVRARLEFLLANYFRRNEDGTYRPKPMVRERDTVLREVHDLQETGLVIEQLITKLEGS